ncbi:MAG: hypothetical protein KJO29_10990, partial [Bacteroidia bacterium]|nr:hypothetical protein [Bacteroidia bacterium]
MKKTLLSLIFLTIGLGFSFAQPVNDTCAGAIDLSNVLTAVGTTDCQTISASDPPITTLPGATDGATDSTPGSDTGSGCSTQGADYWYSWTATTTALYWQYQNAGGDPGIYVYTGSCGSLVEVDCLNTFSSGYLGGWNIGDNLIIQIHDFGTTTGFDLDFCLNTSNEVIGCSDPAAINHNPATTIDNGTCYYVANDVCSGALPWPANISATSCTDGSGLVNLDFGPYGNPFGETNACDGWGGDAIAWY